MKNHLEGQTSPYLLQHAENPVDWYPWGTEAFEKAKRENKPVFLSIGYSACHWCHVMARECFEDEETAQILNQFFISVKVDREERPDVDSVYMDVCTLFTGSGGWPTSVFLTPDKKPFFAGTYFPKKGGGPMMGFDDLLLTFAEQWRTQKDALEAAGERAVRHLRQNQINEAAAAKPGRASYPDHRLIRKAVLSFEKSYDPQFGGFGGAPKFPMPHTLIFLIEYYEKSGDKGALDMALKTLLQMYRGGMCDHLGGGFCRYSTDRYFLAPHFEKMLYDNALMILAYGRAYLSVRDTLYLEIAEKTARYVLRELRDPAGGFYSAQDADSEGEEGKFYLFTKAELMQLLGEEEGMRFCEAYDITERGNFQGKNIPNLLRNQEYRQLPVQTAERVFQYRRKRTAPGTDHKILTSWNGLMIAALSFLYRLTGKQEYLEAAEQAAAFIGSMLTDGDDIFVGCCRGKRAGKGFLADYAFYAYALLCLYEATLCERYLERAEALCRNVLEEFRDEEHGGFYLYGAHGEQLITRPKETYDGAMPAGATVMSYVLVKLSNLREGTRFFEEAKEQVQFLCEKTAEYPAGSCFFLLALMQYLDPPEHIACVTEHPEELRDLPLRLTPGTDVTVQAPTSERPLLDGKTTYYVCRGHTCFPPVTELTQATDLKDEP